MDPNAALGLITAALREDDIPGAAMASQDLEAWLRSGAFAPGPITLAEFLKEIRSSWARLHEDSSLGASEGEPVEDVSFASETTGRVILLRGLRLEWFPMPENQGMVMAIVRDRWKRMLITDILYPASTEKLPTLGDVLGEVARQALEWTKASQSRDEARIARTLPYSKSALGLRLFLCDDPYDWLIREAAKKA